MFRHTFLAFYSQIFKKEGKINIKFQINGLYFKIDINMILNINIEIIIRN